MIKNSFCVALIAVTVMAYVAASPAQAQTATPVEIRSVDPFTPDCNFMSKPGYLRFRTYITQGRWISFEEAARLVAEQEK